MSFLGNETSTSSSSSSSSSSSQEEDSLIRQILLSHDPDGRQLDSELLLRAMENILSCTNIATSKINDQNLCTKARDAICNLEVVGSDEPLGHILYKLSGEIRLSCSLRRNTHTRTMLLLEMLSRYRWDAKAVLMLSSFATSYGEFWLIMQLYPHNPLAASVSLLRQLPKDLTLLKPRFKALSMLVKTIVDVTKCIIMFEGLSVQRFSLDHEAVYAAKSQVYMATYWIIRSSLTCSSQITDLIAMKMSNHSDSETIAAWELSSLVCKLSTINRRLQIQVDGCLKLVESAMHEKLLNLFKEASIDNQEVLEMLFALNDNSPLKDGDSHAKIGVSELKNKVVILLISKPELLPVELLSFLVQQLSSHPNHENLQRSHEVVWVPVSSSNTWTSSEEHNFEFLSNHMPWLSLQKPWMLSSVVLRFIRHVWGFKEKPMMVVLDANGCVTNMNAIDMVLTWDAAKAYPFSATRENELWGEEEWNLRLLLDCIDPVVAKWVEEDQDLCVYSSENLDWIRGFNSKLRNITSNTGFKIKGIYVGKNIPNELIMNILRKEKMDFSLSFENIILFWRRLESMRRSRLRSYDKDSKDPILKEFSELLDTGGDNSKEGWVLIGRGSSKNVVKLQGNEAIEWLDNFPAWGKNIAKMGLANAVKIATGPPLLHGEPCNHGSSRVMPFVEELEETAIVCEKCNRPVERLVFYECKVTQ